MRVLFDDKQRPFIDLYEMGGVSDVDLLMLPSIQDELKVPRSDLARIKEQYEDYEQALLIKGQAGVFSVPHLDRGNLRDLSKNRESLLSSLSGSMKRRLHDIDRYLYLRRFGPERYIVQFGAADKKVGLSQRENSAKAEFEIWKKGSSDGLNAWRNTIRSVSDILPEEVRVKFDSRLNDFESPIFADLTMYYVKDLNKVDLETAEGEDAEYRKLIGHTEVWTVGLDGQWKLDVFVDDDILVDNCYYVITDLILQQNATGGNELEITDEQFRKFRELWNTYSRQKTKYQEEEMAWGISELSGTAAAFFRKRRIELGLEWHQKVWDHVFIPFQRNALIEFAREKHKTTIGPAAVLLHESVDDETAERIREKFSNFQKDLSRIEADVHRQLIELANSRLGSENFVRASGRPSYLYPSLVIMELNAQASLTK